MDVNLHELKSCAEDACQLAQEKRDAIPGAINWGDLGCVGARHWVDEYGTHGLSVYIEEASPGSYELQQFIQGHLVANGWTDVEVNIEW